MTGHNRLPTGVEMGLERHYLFFPFPGNIPVITYSVSQRVAFEKRLPDKMESFKPWYCFGNLPVGLPWLVPRFKKDN